MRLGIGWLIAVVVGLAFYIVFWGQRALWKSRGGRALVIFSLCMGAYAGVKHIIKVVFVSSDYESRYLYDAGSYVTNTHVHLSFSAIGLPSSARVVFGYAPFTATNIEQFVSVYDMTLAEWEANFLDIELGAIVCDLTPEGTNEAWEVGWYIYTTYVVPPSVHTNGVLNVYGISSPQGGVPKKTLVIEDTTLIYPPRQLGDYRHKVNGALNAEKCETERLPYELIDK